MKMLNILEIQVRGAFAMENTADSPPQFFPCITIPKIMFLGIVIDCKI